MMRMLVIVGLLILTGVSYSCGSAETPAKPELKTAKETPVFEIALTGAVTDAKKAEISSMAWYRDNLVLMVQYPARFKSDYDGRVFYIPKQKIIDYLDSKYRPEPIKPKKIDFVAPRVKKAVKGFQGFEAVVFHGNVIFLTIEAVHSKKKMRGYLLKGQIEPDLSLIRMDTENIVKIKPQAAIPNFSEESLLVTDDYVITIYEANGKNVNPTPKAHVFNHNLGKLKGLPFPTIEYRVTDTTQMDADGRFWAINYCFPGGLEKLKPAEDGIIMKHGVGRTHRGTLVVERLVEFRYTPAGIEFTGAAPIQLEMAEKARNWEGLVRLDDRGLLIITDEHPRTILGFIPFKKAK